MNIHLGSRVTNVTINNYPCPAGGCGQLADVPATTPAVSAGSAVPLSRSFALEALLISAADALMDYLRTLGLG